MSAKRFSMLLVSMYLMYTSVNASPQWIQGSNPLLRHLPRETFIVQDLRFSPMRRATPVVRRPQKKYGPGTLLWEAKYPPYYIVEAREDEIPLRQSSVPSRQSSFMNLLPNRQSSRCLGVMPDGGECRAAFPRYYYDKERDQCDCFFYGGCGDESLENSFPTLAECVSVCNPFKTERGPVCRRIFLDEENERMNDRLRERPSSRERPRFHDPNFNKIPDSRFVALLKDLIDPNL